MRKILLTILILVSLSFIGKAQGREVELNVDIPVKRTLTAEDFKLSGRFHLPMTDLLHVDADVEFSHAVPVFLRLTNDQVTAEGQVWMYLVPSPTTPKNHTRPFVFAGMAHNMFIGAPNDATNLLGGFGIQHLRTSGTEFTFIGEFESQNFDGRTVLGDSYNVKFRVGIPVGNQFRILFTPWVSRNDRAIPGFYVTDYGVKVGFGRSF